MVEYDEELINYFAHEIACDKVLLPPGRKRKVARKIYRVAKSAFFGVPIAGFVVKDLLAEFTYAGTRWMTRKIAWAPLIALTPDAVSTTCIVVSKRATIETIRKPVAIIANAAGMSYTLPLWTLDHSMLYFAEKALFGAPFPLLPGGDLRVIHNETDMTDEISGIADAVARYYKETQSNGG